jgi:hypothetical protein
MRRRIHWSDAKQFIIFKLIHVIIKIIRTGKKKTETNKYEDRNDIIDTAMIKLEI